MFFYCFFFDKIHLLLDISQLLEKKPEILTEKNETKQKTTTITTIMPKKNSKNIEFAIDCEECLNSEVCHIHTHTHHVYVFICLCTCARDYSIVDFFIWFDLSLSVLFSFLFYLFGRIDRARSGHSLMWKMTMAMMMMGMMMAMTMAFVVACLLLAFR